MVSRRAARCALEVQAAARAAAVSESPLSVKIGLGAGDLALLRLGGIRQRWELLLADAAQPPSPESWSDQLLASLPSAAETSQGPCGP